MTPAEAVARKKPPGEPFSQAGTWRRGATVLKDPQGFTRPPHLLRCGFVERDGTVHLLEDLREWIATGASRSLGSWPFKEALMRSDGLAVPVDGRPVFGSLARGVRLGRQHLRDATKSPTRKKSPQAGA